MSEELLFDTNCLIDIYKGRERIRPYLMAFLRNEIQPHISVLTVAELWRGLHANEIESHEALLAKFVIIPLQLEAAKLAGFWMQTYQRVGLGWLDALITATAQISDLPLLTRDKRLASVLQHEAGFQLYGN